MSDTLHWTEYLRAFGPTLIASFVAYVAWQQWQVNKNSFREKMFDRRMAVFERVSGVIALVLRDGSAIDRDGNLPHYHELGRAWNDSKFLFGSDATNYIWRLRSRLIDLEMHESLAKHHRTEGPKDDFKSHVKAQHELLSDLLKEQERAYEVFKPYLAFEDRK